MEKSHCDICKKEVTSTELLDSPWENEDMLCSDCYEEECYEVQDYIDMMEYACLNGCCRCCGCSCY